MCIPTELSSYMVYKVFQSINNSFQNSCPLPRCLKISVVRGQFVIGRSPIVESEPGQQYTIEIFKYYIRQSTRKHYFRGGITLKGKKTTLRRIFKNYYLSTPSRDLNTPLLRGDHTKIFHITISRYRVHCRMKLDNEQSTWVAVFQRWHCFRGKNVKTECCRNFKNYDKKTHFRDVNTPRPWGGKANNVHIVSADTAIYLSFARWSNLSLASRSRIMTHTCIGKFRSDCTIKVPFAKLCRPPARILSVRPLR